MNIKVEQYPVFVYGTLRQGERAHGLFTVNTNEGKVSSILSNTLGAIDDFAMVSDYGNYPYIFPKEGSVVYGECIEISPIHWDAIIINLDYFEGEGSHYKRELVDVNFPDGSVRKAYVYVAYENGKFNSESFIRRGYEIKSGDWKARK